MTQKIKSRSEKYFPLKFSAILRVIFFLGAFSVQAQTPYYHTERTFVPVEINIEGTPTEYELYQAVTQLTSIVKGEPIKIDTNNTYAIEKRAVYSLGYGSALAAWNAAINYNATISNYPGKIFDNVGWVMGTRSVSTNWGAYVWILQNQIAFQSSTSSWWKNEDCIPVAISNVMVGTLGNYGPMSNVVDVGPYLDAATFPGDGLTNEAIYQVDYTNVYYGVVIPDIWINPIKVEAVIGSTNQIQLTVYGANIPQGVTWTINPSGLSGGAEIYPSNDWHYASVTPGNVATNYKIRATSIDNTNFYDEINFTVLDSKKIPLGGSTNLNKYIIGKVYVPTKWGGSNTLSGANVELFYTDGSNLNSETVIKIYNGELDGNRVAQGNPCKYDVPENHFGWYYVKVANDNPISISSAFTQTACSSNRPWNFYWWARKGDYIREPESGGNGIANTQKAPGSDDVQVVVQSNAVAAGGDIILCGDDGILQSTNAPDDEKRTLINLFDSGGALEKYDNVYSDTAKAWEAVNGQGSAEWHGHCLGASMASILLNQPQPTTASTLTVDELEGLWAELGEKADIYDIYDSFASDCPAGPPSAGADGTDAYVGELHWMLEEYIRGLEVPLQSNLRSDGGSSSDVWNHAVWKYTAEYIEAPGGNEKIVRITNNLSANDDHEPPTNDEDNRNITYVYILEYKNDGTVDAGSASKDWISVSGSASFALQNLYRVTGVTWGGDNPHVTETNVRGVDESN